MNPAIPLVPNIGATRIDTRSATGPAQMVSYPGDRYWNACTQLIQQQYWRHFSAQLSATFNRYVGVTDRHGRVRGVVGVRCANESGLFIEQYLRKPICKVIGQYTQAEVQSQDVFELGNLAVTQPRDLIPLVHHVAHWLAERSSRWVVFALTAELRRVFMMLDVELTELALASRKRLLNSPYRWGEYYEHDPRVMLAEVSPALDRMGVTRRHP